MSFIMKNNNKDLYDLNSEYYILDKEKLSIGDIILTCDNSLISKIIAKQTYGKFSHAMISVGRAIVIQATLDGVFSENIQRLLFVEKEHVRVLRYKNKLQPNELTNIESYARSLVGSLYSIPQAILARYKPKSPSNRKQFCSRLVANAYKQANCRIDGIIDYDFCTPNDLSRSSSFIEIPNQEILTKATKEQIEFANSKNPISEGLKENYFWLNKIRKISIKHNVEIQTESDVIGFIQSYPQYDDKLNTYLIESHFLEMNPFKTDATRNSYRYNADEFLDRICLLDDLILELEIIESNLERFKTQLKRYIELFKKNNLESFRSLGTLYYNLLSDFLMPHLKNCSLTAPKLTKKTQFISFVKNLYNETEELTIYAKKLFNL